ncbi:hypothetical protein GCM10028791_35080 [Echinicola sediminis]
MAGKKIIYLVGRDNWQKDIHLRNTLVDYLKATGNEIRWEDPAGNLLYALRKFDKQFSWIPSFLHGLVLHGLRLFFGLLHPSYFGYLSDKRHPSPELRSKRLKESLLKLGSGKEIVVVSRSAGGRFSSLIADSLNLQYIICLGYPFKHPNKNIEPERYLHLETIKTPMLIIQGETDEYGGREIEEIYRFSPSVEVLFVEANHDFKLTEQDWKRVLSKLDGIFFNGVEGLKHA